MYNISCIAFRINDLLCPPVAVFQNDSALFLVANALLVSAALC